MKSPLLMFALTVFLVSCGDSQVAGGSSDQGNAITASFVDSSGSPLPLVEVHLFDTAYVPNEVGVLSKRKTKSGEVAGNGDIFDGSADENGDWAQQVPNGVYNMVVRRGDSLAVLIPSVVVKGDTALGNAVLLPTGSLEGWLNLSDKDSGATKTGYIPGTDIIFNVDRSGKFQGSGIPTGLYSIEFPGDTVLPVLQIHSGESTSFPLLVHDFASGSLINYLGGAWHAFTDNYASGGLSTNKSLNGSDLAPGPTCDSSCWVNFSLAPAMLGDGSLHSILKVKEGSQWPHAGWEMTFLEDTLPVGSDKKLYELERWEKAQLMDMSVFKKIEVILSFSKGKELWIELYDPYVHEASEGFPQLGWRIQGTGELFAYQLEYSDMEIKFEDLTAREPNLKEISAIRFFYESPGLAEIRINSINLY